jgi:hypothetical protein
MNGKGQHVHIHIHIHIQTSSKPSDVSSPPVRSFRRWSSSKSDCSFFSTSGSAWNVSKNVGAQLGSRIIVQIKNLHLRTYDIFAFPTKLAWKLTF